MELCTPSTPGHNPYESCRFQHPLAAALANDTVPHIPSLPASTLDNKIPHNRQKEKGPVKDCEGQLYGNLGYVCVTVCVLALCNL